MTIASPLFDCHTHCSCSFDCQETFDRSCEEAIQKGLGGIALTDHFESFDYFEKLKEPCLESVKTSIAAKKKYRDRLNVLVGTELGEPLEDLPATEEFLSLCEFDYVLASLHNSKGAKDFYFVQDFRAFNTDGGLRAYYEDLYETIRWNQFDSMAHISYPFRYMELRGFFDLTMDMYDEMILPSLKLLAENCKALEINTSGLRTPSKKTLPDMKYIKLFREMGGEFVTFGSDAHRAEDVGEGLAEAAEIALACGFRYQTVYENRQPTLIPLK